MGGTNAKSSPDRFRLNVSGYKVEYVEEGDRLLKREYSLTMKENCQADVARVASKELVKETVIRTKAPVAPTLAAVPEAPSTLPEAEAP